MFGARPNTCSADQFVAAAGHPTRRAGYPADVMLNSTPGTLARSLSARCLRRRADRPGIPSSASKSRRDGSDTKLRSGASIWMCRQPTLTSSRSPRGSPSPCPAPGRRSRVGRWAVGVTRARWRSSGWDRHLDLGAGPRAQVVNSSTVLERTRGPCPRSAYGIGNSQDRPVGASPLHHVALDRTQARDGRGQTLEPHGPPKLTIIDQLEPERFLNRDASSTARSSTHL